ncbi:MAG: methyltransferase domain-containing protein [Ferruginibacter sp.]
MEPRIEKVKDYFNETDNYLKDNLEITLRSKLIKENLPEPKAKTIIDIGCGNGDLTLPFIKDNKITFVDLSDKMLDIVRSKVPVGYSQNAEFLNVDLDKFPITKKFDTVFMVGVLAHVNSLERTFTSLAGLLDNNGTLVIQFTNKSNLISYLMKLIFRLKRKFGKERDYKMNYTSVSDITNELKKNNLKYYRKAVYWSSLPGFSLLPKGLRKFVYYKFLNSRLLSPLGGEILLFIRAGKD